MKIYSLRRSQELPISLEEAWLFFSSPGNLKKITPKKMGFDILSEGSDEPMYPGMIIRYLVRPMLNLPVHWVTEITHVNEPYYFVDEQRFGPYAFWHHQHKFKATEKGVLMEDIVNYALPLGVLGRFAHWAFVEKQLDDIFDHRHTTLASYFESSHTLKNTIS
ncbi:SRPBCC family protein [Fulvivirgaceae bacterium BMA12]|uniref:SRPBCC family protein n=1 Tax=Agaribacillus aureus TaxID=3051825 RepID=A0ABT8L3B0_9BACT|nr:SRPBCC family protein [Fulvivirgaceae bacterium BMA12]